ncbi:MAG: hypothetical protein K8R23_01975 [Chthoniobacter sp.]|nr:hypothetical protein [Chthoniobacter sp.]
MNYLLSKHLPPLSASCLLLARHARQHLLRGLVLTVLFVGTGPLWAQLPAAAPSPNEDLKALSFEVRSVGTGGGAETSRSTSTNATQEVRARNSVTSLELKVRNLRKTPVTGEFEYYFVANPEGKSANYVWNQGKRTVTVGSVQEAKEIFTSSELVHTKTRSITASRPSTTTKLTTYDESWIGARPAGWIVRLVSHGEVIRVVASSTEYERVGRDAALLGALVRQAPK